MGEGACGVRRAGCEGYSTGCEGTGCEGAGCKGMGVYEVKVVPGVRGQGECQEYTDSLCTLFSKSDWLSTSAKQTCGALESSTSLL